MPGFEFPEEFSCWTDSSFSHVFKALADALGRVGARRYIQQALVGFCILNHRCSFTVDGQHYRPLALLDLLHEITRPPTKGGQGLNIFGDVQHGLAV